MYFLPLLLHVSVDGAFKYNPIVIVAWGFFSAADSGTMVRLKSVHWKNEI